MRRLIATTVAGLALAFLAMPAPAATLVVNGGELEGADGVLVNGVAYNVRFVEGTCVGLFNGCDALGDFTFTTEADANAASQALVDQIFIGANAAFDVDPELTVGCEDVEICQIFTPYGIDVPNLVRLSAAINVLDGVLDGVAITTGERDLDMTPRPLDVFALWEQAATEVPEPNALAAVLLGSAAGLFAGRRRRGTRS